MAVGIPSGIAAFVLLAGCAVQQPGRAPSPPPAEPPAQAQPRQSATPQGAPVVVTARKWEELVQEVPASVTAISGQTIRDAGLQSIRDAAALVPNTLVTEFSSRRLSFPFIRGVGSGQGEPAVGTYIDGVPQLTASSTNLPLLDVERIEILRGPNSTLYGRNTLGGVVHVISEVPAPETRARAEASVGNFSHVDARASVSTPLVADRLFLGVAGMHSERDGYTDNDFTGNDVDYRDSWFGRGQLYWVPDDDDEVRLVVYGERARDGGFVLSDLQGLRARPHHINQDFEGTAERDVFSTALTWNRKGERADFTWITGVQDWSIAETADFDFNPIDGIRRYTDESQTYLSQELRLGSPEGDKAATGDAVGLRWLVGVSGFLSDADRAAANDFRPGGAGILFPPSNVGIDRARGAFDDYALGVFGQVTVTLFERLDVTGALRYDYEHKKADINRQFEAGGFIVPLGATSEDESYDEILPRLSAAYRWTEDVMVYGLAARGFKAGGFNLTAPAGREAFGTETSWTYEAGVKTSWLEDRLTANAALFHIDWDDMQLSQFDATAGGYVTNAGAARSRGVELEVAALPAEGLQVFGGLGFLDTEFKHFTDSFGQDVSGRNLPFAPDMTWNLGAQYDLALTGESAGLTGFVRGDYVNVGEFFYDAGNRASERYGLTNFSVGLGRPPSRFGTPSWRLEGWVRNAFDEAWVPVAFQPNPADPSQFVGENAAPRTFGVTLRLTF